MMVSGAWPLRMLDQAGKRRMAASQRQSLYSDESIDRTSSDSYRSPVFRHSRSLPSMTNPSLGQVQVQGPFVFLLHVQPEAVSLLFLKRPALDLPQDPAAVSFPFRGDRNAHQLDAAVRVGQPGDDHVADRSAALRFLHDQVADVWMGEGLPVPFLRPWKEKRAIFRRVFGLVHKRYVGRTGWPKLNAHGRFSFLIGRGFHRLAAAWGHSGSDTHAGSCSPRAKGFRPTPPAACSWGAFYSRVDEAIFRLPAYRDSLPVAVLPAVRQKAEEKITSAFFASREYKSEHLFAILRTDLK